MPTRSSSSIARRARAGAAETGVRLHVLVDLLADREHRVERGHGLLKDHRDLFAAHVQQLPFRHREQVALPPQHAPLDAAGRPHQADHRAQGHALARTGFADQAEDLAGPDLEVDAVDRAHRAGTRRKGRGEPLDRERDAGVFARRERAAAHRCGLKRSATPSPTRLKPSPVTTMARPGKIEIHQPVVMKFLPSAISTPHSAAGGCAPRPR